MAKIRFVGIDELGPAGLLAKMLGQQDFPLTSRTLHNSLKKLRNRAIELSAQRMKNPSGAYANGLRIVQYDKFKGALVSTSSMHDIIEDGHPPIDQKKMLQTSDKVRRAMMRQVAGKQIGGWRYLIIPFRHKAADIPRNVREFFDEEGISEVEMLFQEPSVQEGRENVMVTRRKYNWGGRWTDQQNPKQSGMVRLRQAAAGEGTARSAYVTFRTMTENPKAKAKWTIPAFAGHHIFRDTEKWIDESGMLDDLYNALMADIRSAGVS